MGELIAAALALTLLSVPLVFGLQRFGVFKPRLWQVLVVCTGIALVLEMAVGDKSAFYIGYFIAVPLVGVGVIVLIASFFVKKKRTPAEGTIPQNSSMSDAESSREA